MIGHLIIVKIKNKNDFFRFIHTKFTPHLPNMSAYNKIAYNAKINTDGSYRKFCGWTVLSMAENDLKFIENFMKGNSVLRQYLSALPSSSYHMTVYNVWCNGKKFLPHQKEFMKKHFSAAEQKQLEAQSKLAVFFNPKGCINELLNKLWDVCDDSPITTVTLTVNKVVFTGNTVQILFENSPVFDSVNQVRKTLTEVCESDDKMGMYHMTLAYKYKDADHDATQRILQEINILNILLNRQTITIKKPSVYYFSDMEEFIPINSPQ